MIHLRATRILGAALALAVVGCGSSGDSPGDGGGYLVADDDGAVAQTTSELSGCPSSTHMLVCGKNGRTYTNICRAGGTNHIARVGACPGYRCNGVVCVAGFTCRTASNFGVTFDQCVSDTGTAPACSCAVGGTCVQSPSGSTHCEAPAAEPAAVNPPSPGAACDRTCPAKMHCEITTINYGVPAPSCMFD
jgi:hypothetical protein